MKKSLMKGVIVLVILLTSLAFMGCEDPVSESPVVVIPTPDTGNTENTTSSLQSGTYEHYESGTRMVMNNGTFTLVVGSDIVGYGTYTISGTQITCSIDFNDGTSDSFYGQLSSNSSFTLMGDYYYKID